MSRFDRVVEEIIQKAIQDGEFSSLRGKGKPLNLTENPYEPEDWRLANHILRNNEVAYPWMDAGRQIEEEREAARKRLAEIHARGVTGLDWREEVERFMEVIRALNRLILDYNLRVPSLALQKLPLSVEAEMKSALAEVEKS